MDVVAPSGPDPADEINRVGALLEPNRRALYDYVVERRDWVSREQAADAVGLRRGIAAHHLDRLADDGLLEVDYQRFTDRRGPGAGRPAKVYRRAPGEHGVSLPPRQYDLAGKLLADAVDRSRGEGTAITDAIEAAARRAGRQIGAEAKERVGERASGPKRREALFAELRKQGFEPEACNDGVTVLHNCPFHQLSQEHPELICGMNLGLLGGVLDGLEEVGLEARLEPEPGHCCVRFHDTGGTTAAARRRPPADDAVN